MKRAFSYVVAWMIQMVEIWLVYIALVNSNIYAIRIIKFWYVFVFIVCWLLFFSVFFASMTDGGKKKIAEMKQTPNFLSIISRFIDVCIAAAMVVSGWHWYAVMVLVSSFIMYVQRVWVNTVKEEVKGCDDVCS